MYKKIFYSILFIFIFFLSFEFFGRIYIKYNNPYFSEIKLKNKSYGIIQRDSELGIVHKPNGYNRTRVTNNKGFLNSNDVVSPEKRDENSVVFIAYGGSTTFGYNVSQKKTWTNKLQEKLCNQNKKEEKCKYSVLNSGMIMWSIGHVFKKIEKDIKIIKPDYLIIYSGINETHNYNILDSKKKIEFDNSIKSGDYEIISKFDEWWWVDRNLLVEKTLNTMLTNLFNKVIFKNQEYKINYQNFDIIYKNYINVLKKIAILADLENTKLIFVVQSSGINNDKNIYLTSFSQKAKDQAKAFGATVIDSREIFELYNIKKDLLFSETGVHFSEKGSKILSEFLYKKLKENNMIN